MKRLKAPPSLRRLARLPLAPIAALGIAGATAFFVAAMPIDLLERIVVHLRLPALLHAAEPPLGAKAHALLILLAALGAGCATLAGFVLPGRDRPARPPVVVAPAPSAEPLAPATPALRRADAHPDAPPRRPIFAAADLGAPLDLEDRLPATWDAPAEETPPPATWRPLARAAEPVEPETPQAPALVAPPPPASEPRRAAEAAPGEPESIAALLARLEAGLAARERAESEARLPRAGSGDDPGHADSAVAESMDGALRRALNDLQRMAARR